jgi:MoaA/NifB/PqqE/SkfB family radical SAM enzyme
MRTDQSTTRTIQLSQRGEIRLGFRCNARCGFCYYQELLDNPKDKEPTAEQLLSQLRLLRSLGATEVEFTGGEPTISPHLLRLTSYAKELGFVNVSLITNGLRLGNARFARSLVEAGANDFLFSIHGHTSEMHDAHTRIKGSFNRILEGFRNAQSLGARCRVSTTVTAVNHPHLEAIVAKHIELGAKTIHLAVFSPVAQAMSMDMGMSVRYSDAAAAIKRAIDLHKEHLPPLSVKYIPFCFLRGYEQYVMNLYQQSFDPDDWNYYYSNKVRRGGTWWKRVLFDAAVIGTSVLAKDRWVMSRYGVPGLKVFGLTRLVELLRKRKLPACRSCSYERVCDFVWKDYAAQFGSSEITPVPGPKIGHPAWCYELARTRAPGTSVSGSTKGPQQDVSDARAISR